jgi:hypothetical protein
METYNINLDNLLDLIVLIPPIIVDQYVLDAVKDVALLIKITMAKLQYTHPNSLYAIKNIRNMRNKILHGITVDQCDKSAFWKSIKFLKTFIAQFDHENVQKCIQICDIMLCNDLSEFHNDSLRENNRRVSGNNQSGNNQHKSIKNNVDSTIHNFYEVAEDKDKRNALKGMNIIIKSGKYTDKEAVFINWNGNQVKVLIDGVMKSLPKNISRFAYKEEKTQIASSDTSQRGTNEKI